MTQRIDEVGELASIEWQRDSPGPLWSRWLARSRPNGSGLKRWQTWIWWTRRQGPWNKLGALIILVRGIIEAPYEAWGGLRRFGKKTKRVYGIPHLTQYRQLLILRLRFGIRPDQYYKFHLFRSERMSIAQDFLKDIGPMLQVIHRHSPRTQDEQIFLSKEVFERWCAENDIPTVTNILKVHKGTVMSRITDSLPASDLFVKPANWLQGRGASLWRCNQASTGHHYIGNSGAVLNPAELEDFICRTARECGRPYIVQTVLTNHPSLRDLTNGALATVRLMTVRGSNQSAQPL